jgi:hypothetical protein
LGFIEGQLSLDPVDDVPLPFGLGVDALSGIAVMFV